MENREDGGGLVVVIGLVIILLLVGVGGGFFFVSRQQTALAMQAQRALLAETHARMEADRARAAAQAAVASREVSKDDKPATVPADSIRTEIESILSAQEEAWNQGDIEAYMEHYWKSEDLTFSSEGKTTRGWNATLSRYQERYPTAEKMGRLTLDGLEITPLGDTAALVLGKWNVERKEDSMSGNFSLVVRKIEDRWLIVHDHSSRVTE